MLSQYKLVRHVLIFRHKRQLQYYDMRTALSLSAPLLLSLSRRSGADTDVLFSLGHIWRGCALSTGAFVAWHTFTDGGFAIQRKVHEEVQSKT
jgi:hypothetical protein